jgi:hypothetical protein
VKLRTALTIFAVAAVSIIAGCNGAVGEKKSARCERKFLTVDFQQGQTIRYRFVSSRDINVELGPTKSKSRKGKSKTDKSTESMEMVVAYTPIKIDPYGLTTVKATCESVKVRRSSSKGRRKDAVESLPGKTFTLTVGPTGKIEDYSQLDKLIHEIGEKAFRPGGKAGRVKEPDMIDDFIGSQWFLWDSVSSIKKAADGVCVGQTWKSKLSVPNTMVLRKAREVNYTLAEIRRTEKGWLAVIHSSYSPAESVPRDWPIPYSGAFQLSGPFGFLRMFCRGFNVLDLQGQGEELFNIDAGRTEQYNQSYQMKLVASSASMLGTKPRITIKQNLTMQLLED